MMSSAAKASTAPSASGRRGRPVGGEIGPHAHQRRDALPAEEQHAGDHAEQHEAERRQHADRLADQDEAGNLAEDEAQKDKGKGNSHVSSLPAIWEAPERRAKD